MFRKVLIILVALVCLSSALLKQVTVVFRHGERTPGSLYKNDIYKEDTFYPYGMGELINKGKLNQYKQGTWLKERYRDFLGTILTPTVIRAASTNTSRTRMSLSLMLAGLMPPTKTQLWNAQLNWQPFSWEVTGPQVDEILLPTSRTCPRISQARKEVRETEEEIKFNKEHQELYKYVAEHSGETITNVDQLINVYGTLSAENACGLILPDWAQSVFPDKLESVCSHHFVAYTKTKELKKLTGGRILKTIIDNCRTRIESGKADPQLIVYSGHDYTVTFFLRSLAIPHEHIPSYNIMVIIELHSSDSDDGDWYIKLFLRNAAVAEAAHPLIVPGCAHECPFKDFLRLTEGLVPKDVEKECQLKPTTSKHEL